MRVHRIAAVIGVIAVTATVGALASSSRATAHPDSQRIEATISDKVVLHVDGEQTGERPRDGKPVSISEITAGARY